MRQVAIIGAGGKIGLRLTGLLADRGESAVGVVRRPEQVEEIEQAGGRGAVVDLEAADAAHLAEAIRGSETVVFTAGAGPGSGPERKHTVDYAGSVLAAAAAERAGARRFAQISAIGVDRPLPEDVDETWAAYVTAKRDADQSLRETDLAWTILRPGRLTDEPGTGRITVADSVERGSIPRDDVAALVLAVLDDARTIGRQWEAVGGPTPIAGAIEAALGASA